MLVDIIVLWQLMKPNEYHRNGGGILILSLQYLHEAYPKKIKIVILGKIYIEKLPPKLARPSRASAE